MYHLPEWTHICMVGLSDSVGNLLKKAEEIGASHEVLLYRLRHTVCDGRHAHGICEGKETKAGQIWTWKFCRLVADGISELVWLLEVDHRMAQRRQPNLPTTLLAKYMRQAFPAEKISGGKEKPQREKISRKEANK